MTMMDQQQREAGDFTNPCELVRETCQKWLATQAQEQAQENKAENEQPLVVIRDDKIDDLANEILLEQKQKEQQKNGQKHLQKHNDDKSSNSNGTGDNDKKSDWIEWDEEEWHYTGQNFHGHENERKERVALYLLALDAINFCFWPPHHRDKNNGDEDGQGQNLSTTNPLEYEHLAIALKLIAERDHQQQQTNVEPSTTPAASSSAMASYGLSPENLAGITESKLLALVGPYFESLNNNNNNNNSKKNTADPTTDGGKKDDENCTTGDNIYYIPNISKRIELLREVGTVLLERYHGSAMSFIERANNDASKLVELIATSFPGFRDEVVLENNNSDNGNKIDNNGGTPPRRIVFLKRAQILVGDWNAALQLDLNGIDRLTTFADYRVPQTLRHKLCLEYHPTLLGNLVDSYVELKASSIEEISIRAATVVAVQKLVRVLNDKKRNSKRNGSGDSVEDVESNSFTDVSVDWFLWQVGEKMNNEGMMKPFHRVRTHFY